MEMIEGKTIRGERILVADKGYRNCKFVDCTLVYEGAVGHLENCEFINCGWSIEGAARHTIQFLYMMWKSGGANVVEAAGIGIVGAPLQFAD